jgi:hypothetical protein
MNICTALKASDHHGQMPIQHYSAPVIKRCLFRLWRQHPHNPTVVSARLADSSGLAGQRGGPKAHSSGVLRSRCAPRLPIRRRFSRAPAPVQILRLDRDVALAVRRQGDRPSGRRAAVQVGCGEAGAHGPGACGWDELSTVARSLQAPTRPPARGDCCCLPPSAWQHAQQTPRPTRSEAAPPSLHTSLNTQLQPQKPCAHRGARRLCFSWVNPLIAKGWTQQLQEDDARFLVPPADEAEPLAAEFDAKYAQVLKARAARRARGAKGEPWLNATTSTLLRLYSGQFVIHSIWVLVETAIRLLGPLALREFLRWMQRDAADRASEPDWRGWMWALAVATAGLGMTIIHHVFFWCVCRLVGWLAREQRLPRPGKRRPTFPPLTLRALLPLPTAQGRHAPRVRHAPAGGVGHPRQGAAAQQRVCGVRVDG